MILLVSVKMDISGGGVELASVLNCIKLSLNVVHWSEVSATIPGGKSLDQNFVGAVKEEITCLIYQRDRRSYFNRSWLNTYLKFTYTGLPNTCLLR